MELQKEIVIENTPALVSVNFDQLRERLEQELERYRVVVTADTLADAKKLATELNSTKQLNDDRRKAEVAKASEPIKQFDERRKELVLMCAKGRQDILDQVKRFEDETREICRALLMSHRESMFKKHGVAEEFQRTENQSTIEDLVKISHVTAKGALTKAAKDTVEQRVMEDAALQAKIERRLLELENRSYKAGLSAPLQRGHVEAFLFADDDHYQASLEQMISVEVERQEQAEAALRRKVAKENQRAEAPAQQAQAPANPVRDDVAISYAAPERAATPPPAPGKAQYLVRCQFEVEVPDSLTVEAIETELRRVMEKAGLGKTLTGIAVDRLDQAAA